MIRDIVLVTKKIAVGLVVFAVPLGIYYGGLWVVRHLF
jgi:hypothetical protein